MRFAVLFLFIVVVVMAPPAAAQWNGVAPPRVPRNSDGSPNLNGPAPRTGDGKPDLSGVWRPDRNQKCPPDGCPDNQMSEQFLDLGWGMKDGLPYQPWAADLVTQRAARNGQDDPTSHCFPGGIVRLHTYPAFNKIVQTQRLIVILSEREVTYRQIFLDGRPLPKDPLPTWKGYSTGRWEGDTLVVDAIGFNDKTEVHGFMHTEALHVVERFRRVENGLQYEVTVEDPNVWTTPWVIPARTFARRPELETVAEFVCESRADYSKMFKK